MIPQPRRIGSIGRFAGRWTGPHRVHPSSRRECTERAAGGAEEGRFRLSPSGLPPLTSSLTGDYDRLEKLYKHLHTHPELSFQEEQTAARLAKELKELGFEVTEKVGGHGVVGVLKNGKGPTVLVRTDMDALPVEEQTGLPYASKVRARDKDGNEVGVMHACGHDMHMTCWVGTARVLAALKDHWQGTLVFIGQPAEEIGTGARVHAGGRPVQALSQARLLPGPALRRRSAARPRRLHRGPGPGQRRFGGHHSSAARAATARRRTRPSIPIVLAARIVLDLQTIVSRETNPTDPAVVTVGSIHGGTKHNIIPNEVKLQLTVRTTKDAVRKHVLEAHRAHRQGGGRRRRGAPEPIVKVDPGEFTPALFNDPALTQQDGRACSRKCSARTRSTNGRRSWAARTSAATAARACRSSCTSWARCRRSASRPRPRRTASRCRRCTRTAIYPVPEPSIKTGVLTMSLAVLNLMGK